MSHLPRLSRQALRPASEPPIFHACLEPHRSLADLGFVRLAAALTAIGTLLSAALIAIGFWPAALFSACNLAFLIIALRACQLERHRMEQVLIDHRGITVRRLDRHARVIAEEALPLYGLTLDHALDPDFGMQSLTFTLRGQRVEVARDLCPAGRADLARAMLDAMQKAGCPPRRRVTQSLPLLAEG